MKILLVNGVNLDMLGKREVRVYGADTLEEVENTVIAYAKQKGIEVEAFHSDVEGELCHKIHSGNYDGLILNAGAYSHYSIALRDAVACVNKPCVEVHISNLFSREEFRQKSVIAPVMKGVITGFGVKGYLLAVDYFCL